MKLLFSALIFTGSLNAMLVDIGESRKMFLECEGTGSPTIVFISGRSDRGEIWKKSIFSEVAKWTHTCVYDRPGTISIHDNQILTTHTTLVKQPVTAKNGVDDLHALLTVANVKGPYILVAHSYGGLIARLFASTYPKEVAGLVLIDTLTEYLYDKLPPEYQMLWVRLNSHYSKDVDQYTTQERTNFLEIFDEMRKALPPPSMPVIVLTSDQSYDFKALIQQNILPGDTPLELATIIFKAHLEGQKQLAVSLNAKQISNTHAGHYIQVEQPKTVLDAIHAILEEVQTSP